MLIRSPLLAFVIVFMFGLAACGNDDDAPLNPDEGFVRDDSATEVDPTEEPLTPTLTATATPEPEATASAAAVETTAPAGSPTPRTTSTPTPTRAPAPPTPTPTPDNRITVACHDILVPLDKQHRLPADCSPRGLIALPAHVVMREGQMLVGEAAHAFVAMVESAKEEGHTILARSTYRSYETQVATYNTHVRNLGQAQADRVSARPGHSEHQLGTTVDVTTPEVGYELSRALGDTAAGRWIAENSWDYGFVMSYPAGKEAITGYSYEPWHLRYVGPDIAQQVRESGLTLREFLLSR